MRLRLLAAAPLRIAVMAVLLIMGFGPEGHVHLLLRLEGLGVKAVAALGCAVAALTFVPRSRLRLAWVLAAACYAVLALKTAPVIGDDLLVARLGTLAANVLAPLGSLLMVRAWYGSGLAAAIAPLRRRILPVVAFAGAIAVAGPGIVAQVRNLGQDPWAMLLVCSGLGDIASITLLAPLLLIAHAMRGGRLAWPWGLLAAGEMSWLLYDLASSLGPHLLGSPVAVRAVAEVLRAAGCLYYASAGLAQRVALRPSRAAEEHAP